MKRLFAVLLCLVMLLALAACSNGGTENTEPSNSATESLEAPPKPSTDPTTVPTTTPTEAPTEAPTQAPTEKSPVQCSHTYKDATCTAPKTCTKCGATEGKALGHSWTDATCTAPKTCTRCGATEGKALGHSWTNATCTAPKTCTKCGATEGSAAGHSWTDATCTAPKTCTKCGATEGSATGHTLTAVCANCGKTNAEYVDITTGSWGCTKEYDNGISVYTFLFREGVVGVHIDAYVTLEYGAAERGVTVEELLEVFNRDALFVYNGKEYIPEGVADPDATYAEENGVVTVTPEYWSPSKYAELTRTGFAEFTVTSGNYFEIGVKLTPVDQSL